MGFPINSPQRGKMQQNPWYVESLRNWYSYFSHSMGAFFPSDSHPMVYFSIWEMHGFSHKFPTAWENATKSTIWGKSGKLVLILFPWYGCFFSIRFPSYGILYHMGNAWVSHQFLIVRENATKPFVWGWTWDIGTHTFPIVSVNFPHTISILRYTSSHRKCMAFPINSPLYKKMQQSSSYGENLGKWCSYFSHIMGAFFPLDSHFMVYFITWEMHVFSHWFLITWEKTAKTIEWGKFGKLVPGNILENPLYVENLGNWYSNFSHSMDSLFPLDSHSMVYFIICEY